MSLDGAIKKTQGVVIANESADESMTKLQKMMALDKLSGTIVYADILPGVDLEYIVQPYQVKENIIVKEKQNEYAYSFTIKLNNLNAVLNEDGSVSIVDPDTNELVYGIPAPVVYDSNYLYAPEGIASYTLTQSGNNQYILTVSVDSVWMNADERTYPVVVDPTIYKGGRNLKQMRDTFVSSSNASTAYGTQNTVRAGYDSTYGYTRAYILLKELPTLPTNAYLVSANLNLQMTSHGITKDTYLGAYPIVLDTTNMWTEAAMKWNTHPTQFTEVLDYHRIQTGQSQVNYSWDVTEAVRKWYAGTATNHGIAVGLIEEIGATSSYMVFHSSESTAGSSSGYLPFYSFTYINRNGVESYFSNFTTNAGLAGTGYVNRATGALSFIKPLLPTTDSLFSYTPTLAYYNDLSQKSYVYPYEEIAFTSSYMPYGFKLSIQESLIKREYTSSTHTTTNYYVWADADGTEHYFHPVSGSTTEYRDEDGLKLTLDASSSTQITITDSGYTARRFTKMASTPDSDILEAWYLTSIADKNNNVISFTFDSSNRPTKISLIPNMSTQIDFLTISYNSSGMPYIIWNETTKEAIIFKYSSDPTGSISSTNTKYLRQLIYAHGENATAQNWLNFYNSSTTTNITVDATCFYTYNSSGKLLTAKDSLSGCEIRYTYSDQKIATAQEFGYNSAEGQKVGFEYGSGYTKVRTSGSDDIYGNADDIYTVYQFDREGKPTYAYTTDSSNKLLGASYADYVQDNKYAKNNIKKSFSTGGSIPNWIMNGGFEAGTDSNPLRYWTATSNVSRTQEVFAVGGGQYSAEFIVSGSSSESIYQYVKLNDGAYNLALSVNTFECEGVTMTVKATSVQSSANTFVESVPIDADNATQNDVFVNLRINASNDTGLGYEIYKISIEVNGNSNVDYGRVIVDNITLQEGYSATEYNLVEVGAFEQFSALPNGSIQSTNLYFWTMSDSSKLSYITDGNFGTVVKANGQIGSEVSIGQTIYTISNERYQAALSGDLRADLVGEFIVSGFAKAENNMKSDAGDFRLRVEVEYIVSSSGATSTVIYSVQFNPHMEGWQYVCGSFEAGNDGLVKSIKVYAEFSDQPYGTAYFDNISVVYCDENKLNEFDYDDAGRIHVKESGTYIEVYEYEDDGDLSRYANSRGELVDYTYDSNHNTLTATEYKFTNRSGDVFPYPYGSTDDPNNHIKTYLQSETVYTYNNSYGLPTNVTTYPANANGTISNQNAFRNTYSYFVGAGSKIFGAVALQSDSLGRVTRNYYDSSNGRLLACINVSSGDGMAYSYDAIGNLISAMPAKYSSTSSYTLIDDEESVSYTYNSRNFLESITTESTTYNLMYDAFGNDVSTAVGSQVLAIRTYNANNGKISKLQYGTGSYERYVYDELDNLSEIWYNDGGSDYLAYKYTYTHSGQLAQMDDLLSGKRTIYVYDLSGRLYGYSAYDTAEMTITHSMWRGYNDRSQLSHQAHSFDLYSGSEVFDYNCTYTYGYYAAGMLRSTGISFGVNSSEGAINYTYDSHDRLTNTQYVLSAGFTNAVNYTYTANGVYTSSQIQTYKTQVNSNAACTYTYTYDSNGNITKIVVSDGNEYRYKYDKIGQLEREDNTVSGRTYVYTYDNAGNILTKKTYALTAAGTEPSSPISTKTYTYGNADWGDQLTTFNGVSITYDAIGNPLTYYNGSTRTLTWKNGRQLATYTYGSTSISFDYNDEGIRTTKTVGGTVYTYHLNGSQIVAEEWENKLLIYMYDASGSPIGMQYRTTSYEEGEFDTYWFEKNLQGDVIAVYNDVGILLVKYVYDAWGNTVSTTYSNGGASTIVRYNRFRYRGYYYDSETGFYYLNSRYYDPNTGRFINADGIVAGTSGDVHGFNLYAYCFNNPVSMSDSDGNWPKWLTKGVEAIGKAIWNRVDAVFSSIEIEGGLGTGLGVEICEVGVSISNDTYIGFDDGDTNTGHQAQITVGSHSITGKHYAEKGSERLTCTYCGFDYSYKTASDYFKCPHTEITQSVSSSVFSYDSEGNFIISVGASAHLIFGGYINVSFNVTEYLERLFD